MHAMLTGQFANDLSVADSRNSADTTSLFYGAKVRVLRNSI